ncbi:hypothetical protein ACFQ4C_17690 [Larkinella insperata]|uniref:Uncharacterized protein n=1 Tax=Larkinella insperata TaxID=332158 RepID=A0ABW3QKC0_9BACT|nr:hypothetical protein [Larkinella insperata]
MKQAELAAFASRYPPLAAGFIVFFELSNAAIGLIMGSSLLAEQPGWRLAALLAGLVASRALFSQYVACQRPDLPSRARFRFQKSSFFLLFVINFLVYGVAGGISGRAVIHPEPSVSLSSKAVYFSESSRKDSLTKTSSVAPLSQTDPTPREAPHTGTKVVYVLLFLAGAFLALLSSGLACRLACSNHGFAAVMVGLLGAGILAGGIYFLGRAFTKNMKLYREMTRTERQREKRRLGRTLLITLAGTVLFFFLGTIL